MAGALRCAALLAAFALAPACAIRHERVGATPPSPAGLVVGRTTKAEALRLLGPPLSVRRQSDGDLFVYRRDERRAERLLLVPLLPVYERTVGWERHDLLVLLFDAAGVLRGLGEQRDTPPP